MSPKFLKRIEMYMACSGRWSYLFVFVTNAITTTATTTKATTATTTIAKVSNATDRFSKIYNLKVVTKNWILIMLAIFGTIS